MLVGRCGGLGELRLAGPGGGVVVPAALEAGGGLEHRRLLEPRPALLRIRASTGLGVLLIGDGVLVSNYPYQQN